MNPDPNLPKDDLIEKGRELFRIYSDLRKVTDKPEYEFLRDFGLSDEIEDLCVKRLIYIFHEDFKQNNNSLYSLNSDLKKFLVHFKNK